MGPPIASTTDVSDDSRSSSSSAERYSLDESDRRPVLVYTYHGALETSSQQDLCARLDKNEHLRATRKPIPRATSYIDIKRHDLYLPRERALYAEYPNYDSSLASIRLPSLAYWSRLFLGSYDQLYIVSPETSPASSIADSSETRHVSPASTWGADSQDSAAQAAAAADEEMSRGRGR